MTPSDAEAERADGTVRCPTCRAVQEWSDFCRRCKSDLRLLRAFDAACERSRLACIAAIRSGDPAAALRHARRCWTIRPDVSSRRLLALAAFLRADWPTAATQARRVVLDTRSGYTGGDPSG